MPSYMYGRAPMSFLNKEVDWDTDTIKVMLCNSTYVPDVDTHRYVADVTGELADAVGGYTAGGVALSGKTVTYDPATNVTKFDAADAVWPTASFTNARYAVVYGDTGSAATSPLICYVDFSVDQNPGGFDFQVIWSTNGVLSATA